MSTVSDCSLVDRAEQRDHEWSARTKDTEASWKHGWIATLSSPSRTAFTAEFTDAYHRVAGRHHHDTPPSAAPTADCHTALIRIGAAYTNLADPTARPLRRAAS